MNKYDRIKYDQLCRYGYWFKHDDDYPLDDAENDVLEEKENGELVCKPVAKFDHTKYDVLDGDWFKDAEYDVLEEKVDKLNLMDAEVVEEPPVCFETFLQKYERKYAQYFKDYDEFTMFMMLPLNDAQRHQLLVKMSQDKRLTRSVRDCPGVSWQTGDHRELCIPCVTLHRPVCASPFH